MVVGGGGRSGGGGANGTWEPVLPLVPILPSQPILFPPPPPTPPTVPVIPAGAYHTSTRRWESGWISYPENWSPSYMELCLGFKESCQNTDIFSVECGVWIWQGNPSNLNSRLIGAIVPQAMRDYLNASPYWLNYTERIISVTIEFAEIEGNPRVKIRAITNDYMYFSYGIVFPILPIIPIVPLLSMGSDGMG